MDRFDDFNLLRQVIQRSQPFFCSALFNPMDVLISPIYIGKINYSYKKQDIQVVESGQSTIRKIKAYAQVRLRPVKECFIPKTNINKQLLENPIVFFPVESSHVVQFEPIWTLLQSKGMPFIVITTKKAIYKSQREKKRPIIWLNSSQLISDGEKYKSMLGALNEFLSSDFRKDNKNKAFYNLINEILQSKLKVIWNLSERINQIFDKFSPCCVIPGYDITPEGRLLTFLARNRSIPSYCIMHGSITGEPLHTMHIVDHFCLFGEAAKCDLIAKGVDPAQLIVTGAPYLDKFEHKKSGIHPLLKQNLSLTESKPYFFIATSGPGHSTSHAHFQVILENVFEVATRYPDTQWVIRMHLKDRIENYQEVLNRHKNHQIHIIENTASGFPQSIFEWLQGATALLTGTSTVALEAMSMGIPVVTMDFMEEYKMVDFIDLETTIHVTNRETLIRVIRQLTETPHVFETVNERAKAYTAQYFYKSEISASENIVNYITTNIKAPSRCVE